MHTTQNYSQNTITSTSSSRIGSTEGDAHEQTFTVECIVEDLSQAVIGVASSRRKAEQSAAAQVLELIKK